jgi:hypothetical protein
MDRLWRCKTAEQALAVQDRRTGSDGSMTVSYVLDLLGGLILKGQREMEMHYKEARTKTDIRTEILP